MRIAACFLILVLATIAYATSECVACEEFADRPQANLILRVDEPTSTLDANAYYEDIDQIPSRLPINDSVLILELSNSTGLSRLYKIYTDDDGKATYDFSSYSQGCVNFRVLYCPFCDPDEPEETCGFLECMQYANMPTTAGFYQYSTQIADVGDIDSIGTAPTPLNPEKYLPNLAVATYCAPPPSGETTPAMCLPLLLVFALLAGSLYMTGRNPFAAFNIGGARIGRHIKYQARGRGFHMNVMSVVGAATSIAGAIKTVKSGGKAALDRQEKDRAKGNVFAVSTMQRAVKGVKAARAAYSASGRMRDVKKVKDKKTGEWKYQSVGETYKGWDRVRGFGRAMEAIASGKRPEGVGTIQIGDRAMGGAGGLGATIRAEDLVVESGKHKDGSSVAPYIGTLVGTIGKTMAFAFTQTIMGRQIGAFYQMATGRSMAEDWLANHEERLQHDSQVLDAMVSGGAVVVGRTLPIPGDTEGRTRTVETRVVSVRGNVVINGETGERGSVTTVRVPAGEAGEGVGKVQGGEIQIVSNADGQIVRMTYNTRLASGGPLVEVTVARGEGPPGPGGAPPTTVTTRAIEMVTETIDGQTHTTRVYAGESEGVAPASMSAATGAYNTFTGTNTDLTIGSSIEPFHETYSEHVEMLSNVTDSMMQSIQAEMRSRDQGIRDAAGGAGSEGRTAITLAQTEASMQEVAALTGTPVADMDTLHRTFLGAGGPQTTFGVARALANQGGTIGQPGQEAHTLANEVADRMGLPADSPERTMFVNHASAVLNNMSLGQISTLQVGKFREMIQASMTSEQAGIEQSVAQGLVNRMQSSDMGVISERSREFLGNLGTEESFRPALVDSVRSASLAQLSRTIAVGQSIDNGEAASFLAHDPEQMAALPERARQEVREYMFLEALQRQVGGVRDSINSGDFAEARQRMDSYLDTNSGYVDAGLLHTAQRHNVMTGSDYEQAATAVDQLAHSYQVTSQPYTPEELGQTAQVQLTMGNLDGAMSSLQQLYRQARDARDEDTTASALLNMRRVRETMEFEGPMRPQDRPTLTWGEAGAARPQDQLALIGNRWTTGAVMGARQARDQLTAAARSAAESLENPPSKGGE